MCVWKILRIKFYLVFKNDFCLLISGNLLNIGYWKYIKNTLEGWNTMKNSSANLNGKR